MTKDKMVSMDKRICGGVILLFVVFFLSISTVNASSNTVVVSNNTNVSSGFSCVYGGMNCSLVSDIALGQCRNIIFNTTDGSLKLTLCKHGDNSFNLYRKSVPGNKNFSVCFFNGCISNKNNFATFTVKPEPGFDTPGDVLISDQFNNRIIEVNPSTNKIVWSFGSNNPGLCNPGVGTVIGSNWAERIMNGLTVIAGTGIPAGVDSALPDGCVDNRVIVVNKNGDIVWQYGQAGVTGSGQNELNVPVSAIQLSNGHFLITDQGNNRIIEVDQNKKIVWQYGPDSGPGALNSPNSAELLSNGHILIADENNNRVIEITRKGDIFWEYDADGAIAFASRLPNGNTLITDAENAKIFIVSPMVNHPVFEYFTNSLNDSNPTPLPTNAVLLKNGNIAIADQFNHRAIIINQKNETVWQYGITNVAGNETGMLNGPYTAFVIGDYTGQTSPQRITLFSSRL